MCNPRRVRVQATRQLAEAWDHEVRRQVTLGGRAVGRASVREPVAERLGGPVLRTLDSALAGLDGWYAVADGYRVDLDGGYAQYYSDSGELEITAELADDIQAQGEAAATVRAEVQAMIEAQGTGTYFDDGYGGLTEQTAHRDAEADAQRLLAEVAAERVAQARRTAESGADQQLRAQAEAAAQEALAAATAARVEQLQRAAGERLATVGVQARGRFSQAVARATHSAILAYAQTRRAQGLRVEERNGTVTIQFEMET
jgi:FtsH ternary system domain X2